MSNDAQSYISDPVSAELKSKDVAPTPLAPPYGRRERRRLETRTRIEEAGYRLFKAQGVEATSIEQICAEADVARRTFYGHFANKLALLGGLGMSRLFSRAEPMLKELIETQPTTRDRINAMIDYIEDSFADYAEVDRLLILAAPIANADERGGQSKYGRSSTKNFAQMIEAGRELGDVRTPFSSEILGSMIVGTLANLVVSWAEDEEYPLVERLHEARDLFLSLICGDDE